MTKVDYTIYAVNRKLTRENPQTDIEFWDVIESVIKARKLTDLEAAQVRGEFC